MKKEILFGAIALLISAGVIAQTTEPAQTKTKRQLRIEAREQAKIQEQVQSGDPIMTRTQTRTRVQDQTQSGDPIMTKTQSRTRTQAKEQVQSGDPIMTQTQTRKENHGAVVSETARQTPSGEGKGEIVSEQARMKGEAQKSMKQAKHAKMNKGAAKSVRTNRPSTVKGTGAGRK